MTKQILIILMILITFSSCNQTKNLSNSGSSIAQVDTSKMIENQNDSKSASYIDCVRGAAEPIIKKSVFPNSDFKLQADKISGIETVLFDNNDKLIIRNWGCESYCLTFRFETTRFQEDTTNLQFWYKKVALLMSEIEKGLDSPINIDKGTTELINFINKDQPNNYANLKLQTEIDFGGEDIRNYVSIERIQKIDDKKYAIEISYVTGPL